MTIWTKAFWALSALGAAWATSISSLLSPWFQRHALYLHRIQTTWWHDLDKPDTFGFAENQVTPFRIKTPDGESLYAWHISPLAALAKQRKNLSGAVVKGEEAVIALLRDPEARLIINFHGNAGSVAQGWRPAAYKAFQAADSSRFHVLTFDYRGFGHSTGEPTEHGLITDGIAVVQWALQSAQLDPKQIVLLGHSLGTAAVLAVAEHFVTQNPTVEFGGVLISSGFTNIPNLIKTYRMGGVVPILSPLKYFPQLQEYLGNHVRDVWNSSARIASFVRKSSAVNLSILHAQSDTEISWKQSDLLFQAALTGVEDSDVENNLKFFCSYGICTKYYSNNQSDKSTLIRRTLLKYGGHNAVLAGNDISLAILDLFDTES